MTHDESIAQCIADIKEIIALLDPKGAKWAEECKRERERFETMREELKRRRGERRNENTCHAKG